MSLTITILRAEVDRCVAALVELEGDEGTIPVPLDPYFDLRLDRLIGGASTMAEVEAWRAYRSAVRAVRLGEAWELKRVMALRRTN